MELVVNKAINNKASVDEIKYIIGELIILKNKVVVWDDDNHKRDYPPRLPTYVIGH